MTDEYNEACQVERDRRERRDGRCPSCGDRYGRREMIESDGLPGAKYIHTELVDEEEACVEWADGSLETYDAE